jgi:hypothetical protein
MEEGSGNAGKKQRVLCTFPLQPRPSNIFVMKPSEKAMLVCMSFKGGTPQS